MSQNNETIKGFENLEELMGTYLKPLHSQNACRIYALMLQYPNHDRITTHDIEALLKNTGSTATKKEINAWLTDLQVAGLIEKQQTRGKPSITPYEGRYTFDGWRLTPAGIKIGENLSNLMAAHSNIEQRNNLPEIGDLDNETMEDLEDLYLTAKILTTLYAAGGKMEYPTLRKQLCITKEKLAVYSWPDSAHSDKPLFEIEAKPPSMRGRVLRLFGVIPEDNLLFTLTEEGKAMAMRIIRDPKNEQESIPLQP